MTRILLGLLLLLSVTGCHSGGAQSRPEGSPGTAVDQTAPALDDDGTSSGGGNFADTYAKETLSVAKGSLSKIIRHASPEIFKNFPADRDQKWLADVIGAVELRKDLKKDPVRYGSPLKFDYDKDARQIYATKYYVSNFPYGRFWTRPPEEQHRILTEVMIDILHEAAHFYEIGTSEESDPNADAWAIQLMELLSQDVVACRSGPLAIRFHGSAIFLHRPSGMFKAMMVDLPRDTTHVSDSLTRFFNESATGRNRFLMSPRFFLGPTAEETVLAPAAPTRNALGSVAKLVELSKVQRPAVELAPTKTSATANLILQVPHDFYGTWSADHRPEAHEMEGDLGAPEGEAGAAETYGYELPDRQSSRLFEKFVLNPDAKSGVLTYGRRGTEEPYEKTYKYDCQPLSKTALAMDAKIAPLAPVAEPLPGLGKEYSEFGKALWEVASMNRKAVVGKSVPDGRPCEFEIFLGEGSAPTFIANLRVGGPEDPKRMRLYLQTNWERSGAVLYNSQDQLFYNLISAIASDQEVSLRQGGSTDYVGVEVGLDFPVRSDLEFIWSTDDQRYVTRVKVINHNGGGAPGAECTFGRPTN